VGVMARFTVQGYLAGTFYYQKNKSGLTYFAY
jgi:hypothetical protein